MFIRRLMDPVASHGRTGLVRRLIMLMVAGVALSSVQAEENADDAKLLAELQASLQAANPDYKSGGTFKIKEGRLIRISLMRCKGISDLSPLSRFPLSSVTSVILYNATNIVDISPLRDCRLTSLNLERCDKISDLSPLEGMPLKWFRMYACSSVKDLSPLKGMPLEHLDIGLNPLIKDLSPLQGMPLHDLRIDNCPRVTDISVLNEMPIKLLSLFACKGIKDYSPVGTLKLETIYFSPSLLSKDEIQVVRKMESLQKIGTSWTDYRKEPSPDQFWKRYDAGEFRR